ncbi:ABC-2 type transport system permease protein [Amycolatopsis xylanica]|uniref:ABC-2 type transport system permease protein n=1 Tax=Amycolatopsis xylanica TaxID=589385 RepID=A0A1H3SB72_9PSEU|nr:ABC-2 family transporter protein [Amycolatopsis xylanica]SDZ35276.1 ABC-2 type transport system permease protein [Amycolatopsis xylanica]
MSVQWSLARVPVLTELTHRSRLASAAAMGVLQVVLGYFLWHALYAGTTVAAGMNVDQAVTYATMAVLVTRIRWASRIFSRDALWSLVNDGRIAYWFLRPVSARRYHLLKSTGEALYWGGWSLAGYLVALATGLIQPPPDPAVALASVVSLLLGQVVEYHLLLAVDLLCFWMTTNNNARRVYHFIADFLSGAFVPLWYLPDAVVTFAGLLPFQSTLNVPLSLYTGRIPPADAPGQLMLQAGWCVLLAGLTRVMWARVERRVETQGG